MMLRIFNPLTKETEEIKPLRVGEVGMYACGPTVYDYPHIGHGRKYVNDDILKRTLSVLGGLKVTHVQNITDVGHLVSDADEGEDKLEKGARRTGESVWEVAQKYTDYFLKEMDLLNIIRPDIQCKATDHIEEQIELIKQIMEKGYAYETEEAVYFDVSKFKDYDKLFGQSVEDKLVGVREEVVTETSKKHPADFSLWFKRVGKFVDHTMFWPSPWGDGFPGWHIECSAMSMKYLGEQIDIHTGGEDHVSIHHPNEIAQSESATGKKPFVKYWFHSSFLMVDGKKMSKSLGNFYRVTDLVEKGFSPMALRYYYLSAHYRKQMNFTWEGMTGAQVAYDRLNEAVSKLDGSTIEEVGWSEEGKVFYDKFTAAMEDDLNTPLALAVVWETVKSSTTDAAKINLMKVFDAVLGLDLGTAEVEPLNETDIPEKVKELIKKREDARLHKKWEEADGLRVEIERMGFRVLDAKDRMRVEKVK